MLLMFMRADYHPTTQPMCFWMIQGFSIPEKELHALILTEMVKVNTKPITTERIKNIAELLALYITGPL